MLAFQPRHTLAAYPLRRLGMIDIFDILSSRARMELHQDIDSRAASLDFSVLICTYNRAPLLMRTLEHVAAQVVPAGTRWEIIVVDNNCADDTSEVVRRCSSDPRIPTLRSVREPQQGIAFARRRAFLESRGELLACVDDDCLLAPNWVEQALQFAREHPRAGAFGGRNAIVWETSSNRVAELYGQSLTRQELGDQPFRMSPTGRSCLVGAGLVVRREAIMTSRWIEDGVLVGRCADALGAGEDAEIFFRIRHAGWECWYTPKLVLSHIIPEMRTTLPYLRRLHHGFGKAEAFLRALSRVPSPRFSDRLAAAGWSLGELRRVLARWPRGYLQFANERPTWLIRMSYALGCVQGAIRYLLTGRA
jgi:glycosyltransferase involved in cell wall biosynthesis